MVMKSVRVGLAYGCRNRDTAMAPVWPARSWMRLVSAGGGVAQTEGGGVDDAAGHAEGGRHLAHGALLVGTSGVGRVQRLHHVAGGGGRRRRSAAEHHYE